MPASATLVPGPVLTRTVLAALALSACAGPEGSSAPAAETWAALPPLSVDTVATLGGAMAEGPDALGSVRAVAVLSDPARIAVADVSVQEIRLFTPGGAYLGSVGRRGEGPGEFEYIGSIAPLEGGAFGVWDTGRRAFARFDSAGSFLRFTQVRPEDLLGQTMSFVGAFPDGRFVLRTAPSTANLREEEPGIFVDTVTFRVFGADGEPGPVLSRLERPPRLFYNEGSSWGFEDYVFAPSVHGVVAGDRFLAAASSSPVLSAFAPTSQAAGSVPLQATPRPVTPAQVAAERAHRIETMRVPSIRLDGEDPTERLRGEKKARLEEVEHYDSAPIFDDLLGATDGSLWLKEFPLPDQRAAARWVHLGPDGDPRGQMTLPPETRVMAAGGEHVVLFQRDELDAAVLLVLRLASR